MLTAMRIRTLSTMQSNKKAKLAKVAEHWSSSRPLPWRLRAMLNQRRRWRGK